MDFKNLTSNCPECRQKRFNCAFFTLGKCTILNDTKFNRPCPFMKTLTQIAQEKEKWSHR